MAPDRVLEVSSSRNECKRAEITVRARARAKCKLGNVCVTPDRQLELEVEHEVEHEVEVEVARAYRRSERHSGLLIYSTNLRTRP